MGDLNIGGLVYHVEAEISELGPVTEPARTAVARRNFDAGSGNRIVNQARQRRDATYAKRCQPPRWRQRRSGRAASVGEPSLDR